MGKARGLILGEASTFRHAYADDQLATQKIQGIYEDFMRELLDTAPAQQALDRLILDGDNSVRLDEVSEARDQKTEEIVNKHNVSIKEFVTGLLIASVNKKEAS